MILLRNKISGYTLFIYNEYKYEIITYLAMINCMDWNKTSQSFISTIKQTNSNLFVDNLLSFL